MKPDELEVLEGLVDRAGDLLARTPADQRCLLGVVGAPGGGKSTLVEALLPALAGGLGEAVAHVPMDGFHLADAQLDRLGRRERKGAPDTYDVDGYAAALFRCRHDLGHDVFVPGFERSLEQPIAAALVVPAPARLVLTEGNYLLHDADGWDQVRPLLDECWYVDLADEVRRQRLVARHVLFGKSPDQAAAWVETVDEPNALLVAHGRSRADLVIAP